MFRDLGQSDSSETNGGTEQELGLQSRRNEPPRRAQNPPPPDEEGAAAARGGAGGTVAGPDSAPGASHQCRAARSARPPSSPNPRGGGCQRFSRSTHQHPAEGGCRRPPRASTPPRLSGGSGGGPPRRGMLNPGLSSSSGRGGASASPPDLSEVPASRRKLVFPAAHPSREPRPVESLAGHTTDLRNQEKLLSARAEVSFSSAAPFLSPWRWPRPFRTEVSAPGSSEVYAPGAAGCALRSSYLLNDLGCAHSLSTPQFYQC